MFDMKDIILEGIVYTIMGILIVFAMLVIIMLVIKAMQIFSGEEKPVQVEITQPQVQSVPAEPKKNNDDELIAVITAAITAAMGKSSSGFIVRSYKKISGNEWNRTGRREILENRF